MGPCANGALVSTPWSRWAERWLDCGSSIHDGSRIVADEPSYEEGDRVAVLRMHGLTGEIQIIPATIIGVIDEYRSC